MKKISSLLVVLLLMLVSLAANAQEYPRGDVSYDGQVNITDVTWLINYLLTDTWPENPVTPDDHEWVDLGLTSGTLWATMNVGANAPEEIGDYFAWGEIEPKEVYEWMTYKWCNGTSDSMTKYCTSISGIVDGRSELEPEDDAAYMNWGPQWRIPTYDQIIELVYECTWTWTSVNGVDGRLGTGPNGNTLFIPVAGFRIHEEIKDPTWGYYWSRNVYEYNANMANNMVFHSQLVFRGSSNRHVGEPVRPVRISQE